MTPKASAICEVGGVDQRWPLGGEPRARQPAVPGTPGPVRAASAGPARRRRHKSRPGPGAGRTGHAAPATAPTTARRSPAPPRTRRRRWLPHSRKNSVIERWNSSAGACTGRFTQWSRVPSGDRVEDRPHRVPVTPAHRGHPQRRSGRWRGPRPAPRCHRGPAAPTPPMTSATGRPAARRSRIHGSSSPGRPQATI